MQANSRPLYIFDIDGTLAIIEHRLHHLQNKNDEQRWKKFYKDCSYDATNIPVMHTMETLQRAGAEIWFFSGRSEDVREETVEWLSFRSSFTKERLTFRPEILTMRGSKDFREDDVLKEEWLHNMLDVDRKRLVAVFDDRDRVVAMWRRNGVPCFQVAPGAF